MNGTPPHVIMVTNAVSPDKLGGLERYVRELSAGLVAAQASVTVIAKRTAPEQPDEEHGADGVLIRRFDPPRKTDPLFAVRYPLDAVRGVHDRIARAVRDGGTRRVLLHGHFPVPMIEPALSRTPYVYTCHAPVHRELLSERRGSYALPAPFRRAAVGGLRHAERHVLRRAHTVVTLSAFVRSEVATLDRRTGARVVQIPGGLDTEWFRPDGDAPARRIDRLSPVLFTARRLVERTGVDALVDAMPSVLSRIPGARLHIAGSGPLGETLAQRIADLDLGSRVELLGRIPEEELRERYRQADLAITPTTALEGFGLSTAEALACGTVAVVTPIGANPEVVDGLSPALVARSAAPTDIADAIVRILDDPDLDALRDRARDHVHPRWSWPAVVERHLDLYRRVPGLR